MGFFSPSEEDLKKKEQKRLDKERKAHEIELQKQKEIFNNSPPGQARIAREKGVKIFQIDMPLSKTRGFAFFGSASVSSSKTKNYSNLIQRIEAEGWHLEHVDYIYRFDKITSTSKAIVSGQQEAVRGEIIGIYIFRAVPKIESIEENE